MGDTSRLVMIRCPDHHEILVNGLWNMMTSQCGVDYDFPCGDEDSAGGLWMRAHRLIVQVFMPLEAMERQQSSENEMNCSSAEGLSNLDSLIEFLYKGQVTVREEQLESLLRMARRMNFKMLADAVLETTKVGAEVELVDSSSVADRSCSMSTGSEPDGVATRSSRQQRKGKPVKLSVSEAKADAGGWSSPASKRLRSTRARTEVGLLIEQSSGEEEEEEDDWNQDAESDCADEELTPLPARRTKSGAVRKVSDVDGADRVPSSRTAGRPPSSKKLRQPTLKCEHCTYKTYCKTRFQLHAASHDTSITIFRCSTCSKPFLTSDARLSHVCEPKMFKCPHCPYQTSKKVAHQMHLAKHDASVAVYKCSTCYRPFSCRESLERHEQRHRIYRCPHCDFSTPKGGSYHHHLRSVHKVNTKGEAAHKRFRCDDCAKTYMYESELKYHMLAMHSGEKPFLCPQCSYATGRKVDVARHIKVAHLNIKRYMCEQCGFRAVTPFNLERHRISHTGTKPYQCDVCSVAFADRDTLKRHARLHVQNEKPFICHICAHGFNRRHNLKVHLKNVHKTPMEPESSFKT